jgi:ribosome-binding protein aMBF1 (putative translation factor)
MIRTRKEYQGATKTLIELRASLETQRRELEGLGLSTAELERALQPVQGFIGQVEAEQAQYSRWRAGHVDMTTELERVGTLLIALRIARGWSQRELAARLRVSEAQVSRDERNEYHAITVDRAQRILNVLGAEVTVGLRADATTPLPATATGAASG